MNDLSEFKLPAAAASDEGWCVYLLLCRGGALYCGISNRPDERFAAHCAGRGAKFTRMHKPQEMRLLYAAISRSEAARIEPLVKKLVPEQKRRLWAALAELAAQHHAHTAPKPRASRLLESDIQSTQQSCTGAGGQRQQTAVCSAACQKAV